MKIREYNEMMRYLTRPKEKFKGTFVKQKNSSTKPSFKDKTPLKVAALPPGTDRVKMAKGSTPNPRIMVNYANPNIFEGLNPEDDDLLELAIDCGANECFSFDEFHEIHTNKNEVYNIKKKLENKITNFISTDIEWIPFNYIELSKEQKEIIVNFLETLEDNDDVQKVYTNVNFKE